MNVIRYFFENNPWLYILLISVGLFLLFYIGYNYYTSEGKKKEVFKVIWKIMLGLIGSGVSFAFVANVYINSTVQIDTDYLNSEMDILKMKVDSINAELKAQELLNLPPFFNSKESEEKYYEAKYMYDSEQYSKAVETLNRIPESEEDIAYKYYWLGENYFALNNIDLAIGNFRKIVDNKELSRKIAGQKKIACYFMLARCYESRRDYREAKKYYIKVNEAAKYNYCQPIFDIAEQRLESWRYKNL